MSEAEGFGVRRHVAAFKARTCPRSPDSNLRGASCHNLRLRDSQSATAGFPVSGRPSSHAFLLCLCALVVKSRNVFPKLPKVGQACPRLPKPLPPRGGGGLRRVYSVILSKTPDLGTFVSSLLSIWPQSTQINPSMPKYRPHTGSYWPKNLVFPFCHLP